MAHYVTSGTQVIATLTTQGVTLADTVLIQRPRRLHQRHWIRFLSS